MAGRQRPDPFPLAGLLVAIGALLVYRATLLPGVSQWDTAEAQTVLPLMGTMHPTGFPAYVLLGWLASVVLQAAGEPALRINLLSALLAAATVGLMLPILRRLGVPLVIAVAAASGLALTPISWQIATAADVHALHFALLALLVLVLLRWERLVAERDALAGDEAAARRADRGILVAAAVLGVSLANHGLTLLLLPAASVFVLAVDREILRRPRLVLTGAAIMAVVAAVLYLELPLRAGPFRAPIVYGHPETWDGFWEIVLARQFQGGLGGLLADPLGKVADLARVAVAQLGGLAILVPLAFATTAVRLPRYALLSGIAAGLTVVFAASYPNAAIERYYLGPVLFAWTWLAVLAATLVGVLGGLARRLRRAVPAVRGVEHHTALGGAGTVVTLIVAAALVLPTGLEFGARWRTADRSQDTTAAAWLDEAFASIEPGAVVLSWWGTSTTLWYGQLVEHRRPDLWIVDDRTLLDHDLGTVGDVIDASLDSRPVYVIRAVPSDIEALALRYGLEPVGRPDGVYRVTGRQETQP